MSQIIRNGESRDIAIPSGGSLLVATTTGTYSASIIAGVGTGTTLATASKGDNITHGPYTSGAVIRLTAGLDSVVAFDYGTNNSLNADRIVRMTADGTAFADENGNTVNAASIAKTNKRYYVPIGTSITPGSTLSQTWCAKFAIPSDADEVGLVIRHHDTSNALTGVRACIAATESFYPHSTTDDKFHPFVQGTGRRVLDDATTLYGWRSVTWGGASSPTLAAPSAIGGAGFTNLSNVPSVAESDGIFLPPDVLPSAADIAAGGDSAFRYVLARVFVPGAAGNKYAFSAFAPSTSRSTINNGWVSRFSTAGGDIVTTSINTSTGDATSFLPVGLWYRSRSLGYGVVGFGDSLLQGQGSSVTDEAMQPWLHRACAAKGATFINFGCSGQTQATFYSAAQTFLASSTAQYAVFGASSPNDGPWATLLAAQQYFMTAKQRVQTFISLALAAGKRPIIYTQPPCSTSIIPSTSTGAQIDAERRAHNAWVKTLTNALVLDYDGIFTDGGTVDAQGVHRFKTSLSSDTIHPNEAGSKLLNTAMQALIL